MGLFRPVTLHPYPYDPLRDAALRAERVLCIEMNMGQMLTDVRLAVGRERPIDFYGSAGGVIPSVEKVIEEVRASLDKAGAGR